MSQRQRGRPPKYPASEVRSRLIAAAREILGEHGIASGLDAITLDGAIARADVPRGSAYKLWQEAGEPPQDVFRRAVVLDVLRDYPAHVGLPLTTSQYEDLLAELTRTIDPADRDAMWSVLVELIRIVASENFNRLDGSDNWCIYNALRTAALTRGDDQEIAEAVRAGEETLIAGYATLFEQIARHFDHTIRPEFTYEEFASVIYALNDGLANRSSVLFRRRDIKLQTGPHREVQDWTLFAATFHALIDFFFEPVEPTDAG